MKRLVVTLFDLGAALVLLFTLAALVWSGSPLAPVRPERDAFDPRLLAIRDVDTIVALARKKGEGQGQMGAVKAVEDILRQRFYHGYSRYGFGDNWVLWLANAVIDPDLSAKVFPEDILDHPWAACSQQALVVQAALQRMGIPYATVLWPSHFTAAAFLDGQWYVVDPWEPMDRDRSRLWLYETWVSRQGRAAILGPLSEPYRQELDRLPPALVEPNAFPAPTMAWFHPLTSVLSHWLWLAALGWLALRYRRFLSFDKFKTR